MAVPVVLGVWLMSMVTPIVRRVLIGLGIGLVTYTGMSGILSVLQQSIVTSMGGMTGAAAQVAAILGFHDFVGIILGAITTRMTITQLTKWGRA